MAKGDIAKGLGKIILLTIAVSGLTVIAATSPGFGAILREVNKRRFKDYKQYRINQSIKRLQTQELITINELEDRIEVQLTEKGKIKVLTYNLEQMQLKAEKWDHVWRIVIFDIPNTHKKARDILRTKMKQIGFYLLQESVLVTPWKCRDEIDFIKHIYQVADYVTLIEAINFDGEIRVKQYFRIT